MRNLIIRLLAAVGFKKAIGDYVYAHQSKTYREYLEFAFVDSKGKKYYRFNDLKNMPLALLEQLTILQLEIESRIKGPDLDEWIAHCKAIVSSGSRTAVADVGHMLGALEERRTVLLDPVLMLEVAALLYIREDEDPTVYNKDLHREKFIQLNEDQKNTLYDFFVSAGLSRYFPSAGFTPQNWQKFLESQMGQIEAFTVLLGKIGTLKCA
ncbi:MAG TPA: hypothetical protein VG603_05640 [Chitinophagales bacterium]|nr:hypothetical protein [Chitinophagales bacterium]